MARLALTARLSRELATSVSDLAHSMGPSNAWCTNSAGDRLFVRVYRQQLVLANWRFLHRGSGQATRVLDTLERALLDGALPQASLSVEGVGNKRFARFLSRRPGWVAVPCRVGKLRSNSFMFTRPQPKGTLDSWLSWAWRAVMVNIGQDRGDMHWRPRCTCDG
jgi:hypothetical protein